MNTPLNNVLSKLGNVKKRGKEYSARCPGPNHKRGDKNPSLSVSEGEDGRVLLKCHRGCELEDILTPIGLTIADLFNKNGDRPSDRRLVEDYIYEEKGKALFKTLRYDPKDFLAQRPGGQWGLGNVKPILYKRDQLRAADKERRVFIAEGEKCVNKLIELDFIATCNPFGALKWKPEYSEDLRDRHVIVLPDNDPPDKDHPLGIGREHAEQIAQSIKDIAASVKVVELPGLPEKGDIIDWLAAGHTKAELIEIVKNAPAWEPTAAPEAPQPEPFAMPLEDFMSSGPDSVEWLVDDLLPRQGIAILASRPKAGKSLLTFNLALGLRRGLFLGRECRPARSLILQLEDPPTLIRERITKMGPESGIFIRAGLGLSNEDFETLPLFIKENDIDLIAIDPLIFAAGGADENDAAKMGRFFLALRKLAFETGAALLVVHHHRKSPGDHGDAIRGSSAILGAVDVALELRREDEDSPTATLYITSRMAAVEPETLTLDTETLTWTSQGSAREYRKTKREQEIIEALEGAEMDIETLAETIGVSKAAFYKELKNLVAQGTVKESKKQPDGGGRPRLFYRLQNSQNNPPKLQNSNQSEQPKEAENEFCNQNDTLGVQVNLQNSDDEDLTGFAEVEI